MLRRHGWTHAFLAATGLAYLRVHAHFVSKRSIASAVKSCGVATLIVEALATRGIRVTLWRSLVSVVLRSKIWIAIAHILRNG